MSQQPQLSTLPNPISSASVSTSPTWNQISVNGLAYICRIHYNTGGNCTASVGWTGCFFLDSQDFNAGGVFFGITPQVGMYLTINFATNPTQCVEVLRVIDQTEYDNGNGIMQCPSNFDPNTYPPYTSCPCNVPYGHLDCGMYLGAATAQIYWDCSQCITYVQGTIPGCLDDGITGTYNATRPQGFTGPADNHLYNCAGISVPLADDDDACCFYLGCADSVSSNVALYPDPGYYDPNFDGCDDGFGQPDSNDFTCCGYYGCTDPIASNYDSTATIDDGSCITIVVGCMDDGCCTNGTTNTVGAPCTALPAPMYGGTMPTTFHLCPNSFGISYDSSFPTGCIPGTDCQMSVNYDSSANEDDASCIYELGYSCLSNVCWGIQQNNPTYPCYDVPTCTQALADCVANCGLPLDACAVFMNDAEGWIYSYDPDNTTLTPLFQDEYFNWSLYSNNPEFYSHDIANTETKMWLYSCADRTTNGVPDGILREYDITINPVFTVNSQPVGTINPAPARDIDITDLCYHMKSWWDTNPSVGSGLVAKDDDTLIFANSMIVEVDISNGGAPGNFTLTSADWNELFVLPHPGDGGAVTTNDSISGPVTYSGATTGDVLVDSNTGNIIVTYYHEWPRNGAIGQFELNAGGGAQMLNSNGAQTNWWETIKADYPVTLPSLYGLFIWNTVWYGTNTSIAGSVDIHEVTDISTLTINTAPYDTQTLLPTTGSQDNYTLGASQQPQCITIVNVYGCTDPAAVNYNPLANIDDGSCIYPELRAKDCLPRLTKEEFLMNVCQKPETRSDVFIERGKVSVFERPQRLAQISPLSVN